ncbi:MAG: arsenate reductase family protein [Adlercreutzia equolifaciens]
MAADVLFLEYPKCSTCQKAKKWLDAHGVAYADRHIVEDNPPPTSCARGTSASEAAPQALLQRAACFYREMELSEETARDVRRRAVRPARATSGMLVR